MNLRAITLFVLGMYLVGTPAGGAEISAPADQIPRFRAVDENLKTCLGQLDQVLSQAPRSSQDEGDIQPTMDGLASIVTELGLFERQLNYVMDDAIAAHLEGEPNGITVVLDAFEEVKRSADGLTKAVDEFLAYEPGVVVPQEVSTALKDLKEGVKNSLFVLGFGYYRAYVPVRFVQFVEDEAQILSGERLQYNLDIANEIFRPARMRFFRIASIIVWNSEFTDLHRRWRNGAYMLDPEGGRIAGTYTWPEEIWKSPLVWPLHWPQIADCEGFVLPKDRTESRYWAQMRAGTYCCREGEMLVYINQGISNGGQYPWYSRIIGMSSYHMAHPNSAQSKFVFAHEVGHYLGLPHTFPGHHEYGIDYDLAVMINCPEEGPPQPGQQRFYRTHENLVNPETGETAALSLFWDLVFKPICPGIMDPGVYHLFFQSREEAAMWEEDLQPIEQWSNGHLCRQSDQCCENLSQSVRLQLTVGAGCRGVEDDFSDCICPADDFCTGHWAMAAFSRFGRTPDTIRLNVMSYGYPMLDGSSVPEGMVDPQFVCQSQLEQIDRVMTHDVDTFFFPDTSGKRPALGRCESCHTP